ncbi:MAG TPA: glycosyltransferase family 2 protein [Pseudolabrys sp.]|nr:glycosyltransferase family 2 protein [Pseudolabrys sp.]
MTTEKAIYADAKGGRFEPHKIAVLVPCYNEEATITKVVEDFRAALPAAEIFVFDNSSTDNTGSVASASGAVVFLETHRGKGFVVRRMFSDVEADVYVLVDGDATYDAPSVRLMVTRLLEGRLDMVVGSRVESEQAAYRAGHRTGNRLLSTFVALVFDSTLDDVLSGYRVFSRRFVKSFPVLSGGFEIETELTIHALQLGLAIDEIPTPYCARPKGSVSKLHTWRDGFRILLTIFNLYRAERPLAFYTGVGAAAAVSSIAFAIPIVVTYLETGLVPRLPTAVLATGLMLSALLCMAVGLVLDTVTRGRREMKLLAYLSHRAPGPERRQT